MIEPTDSTVPLRYPAAERSGVVDNYHGTPAADPYREFEKADSPVTREWVKAQNALAQPLLQALPQREWIRYRLASLWNYERHELPVKRGRHYFYLRNEGTQNQNVLYVSEDLNSAGRVLVDPNSLQPDGTVAFSLIEPDSHGLIVAYALSDGGSDWHIWKFRRTSDATDLPDTLQQTKFWNVSWARDGSGVYYKRDGR
jgi:prolyl oligopeptidase